MVTVEEMARAEGVAAGVRETVMVTRKEIDRAYQRGFDDGRDSTSALPALLVGAVSGAFGMLAWVLIWSLV